LLQAATKTGKTTGKILTREAAMAEKLLKDSQCKVAKPKAGIYYKSDGAGLRLQVRPKGVKSESAKYWQFRYTLDGRESTYQIGSYPDVSLEEARDEAAKARKLVGVGIRPSVDRKVQRANNVERTEATFKVVANEWLAKNKADWSGHHFERNTGILTRILFPDLGALPVTAISEAVLLKTLVKHYDAGIRESARRARVVAAQVFSYAKSTHRATMNPARELAGNELLKKPDVTHFAAIKQEQVGPMLRALKTSQVEPVTRGALLLMLYTGVRDAALRGARWHEFDLEGKCWTVPAERMKSGREHKVPLPRQAVEILSKLAELTRKEPGSYVFASHSKAGFLAENSLRLALHRIGFKVTAHGFRSLITNVLNVNHCHPDAIERQLDHAHRDKVRASYLNEEFWDIRQGMMQWLADWADAQRNETEAPDLPSNVIPMRRAA
jgi:integrase